MLILHKCSSKHVYASVYSIVIEYSFVRTVTYFSIKKKKINYQLDDIKLKVLRVLGNIHRLTHGSLPTCINVVKLRYGLVAVSVQ